jgi:molybdenum cofactor synthesis domain-containing protein
VLTVSDGVAGGTRHDESGEVLAQRLERLGFTVERAVAPDDEPSVARFVRGAAAEHRLVVTTGGTGLGPRDRTPEALRGLIDYEIPGFGELMRAVGRASTPFASLSRSLAGAYQGTLVLALPGSPRGALESLEAVVPILEHALATLGGDTGRHPLETGAEAAQLQPDPAG